MDDVQQGPDLRGDTCVIDGERRQRSRGNASGDEPDGDIPVEGGLWTRDGGATWS